MMLLSAACCPGSKSCRVMLDWMFQTCEGRLNFDIAWEHTAQNQAEKKCRPCLQLNKRKRMLHHNWDSPRCQESGVRGQGSVVRRRVIESLSSES